MSDLVPFKYEDRSVRTLMIDGAPWFVASDVCRALELTDTAKTVSYLDEDEKLTRLIVVSGQSRKTWLINEPGLYSLILRSRKPEAKAFKRWITHEVLPQIRRTGRYEFPADTTEGKLERAREYVAALELVKAVEDQNRWLVPRAQPTVVRDDGIPVNQTWWTVRDHLGAGAELPLAKFWRELREIGAIVPHPERYPTQAWIRRGLAFRARRNDRARPSKTALFTPEGVEEIIRLLSDRGWGS